MFARWGALVVRARWAMVVAALVVVGIGATWGAGVFGSLASGGFLDQNTPSGKARAQVTAAFGAQDPDIFVLYSSTTESVTDPAFRNAVTGALTAARARPEVSSVVSYYATPVPQLVSTDGHRTYAVVKLRAGGDDSKLADFRAVRSAFVADPGSGVTTLFGGVRPFYDDANLQTKKDIERAEAFSLPILLILLVLIFRSAVAALTPLLVGGLAILGGFVVVRLITQVTTVSTFAINIITLIGLGLAIDYSLFVVSRFREELATGKDAREAVIATMATAGRTVAVSGLTVTLALAGLLMFPQIFLHSMGYGAMAAVAVAMLASLTVLPAGLALLGPKINAGRVRLPRRRPRPAPATDAPPIAPAAGALPTTTTDGRQGAWSRLAWSVMRRPWLYLVGVLVVLTVLAAPVLHIKFGGLDTRVLPASAPSRVVNNVIADDFPPTDSTPVQVLVTGVPQQRLPDLVGRIEALPTVTGAQVTAVKDGEALLSVDYRGIPTGSDARDTVTAIRAMPAPPGATIAVTGGTADLIDQLDGLGARMLWMILFVVVVTSVLLFLAFGSVVLPIKAILMNVVSLGAAFGAVVYIFQDGHFASWLNFTPSGVIEPTNPILMIVVLFGLATDYEVFLLSRIREEWDTGADNQHSVAAGLQRTGRIITSAALLLIVVIVGFASGEIGFVKMIGVGMIVAILVDATLVRALLVPATMRLLGRWNWWAPGPLARVYRRYGIRESESVPMPEPDAAPVG